MVSFWQCYAGFCLVIGGFVWIVAPLQGFKESEAALMGLVAFVCAPMVAMALAVSALASRSESC